MDMSRQSGKHNQQLHSEIYLFSSGGETIDAILVIRFMLRDLPAAVYDFCLGVNKLHHHYSKCQFEWSTEIPQQLKQQSADIMCSSFTNTPPNHSPFPKKTTIFATLQNYNITLLKL